MTSVPVERRIGRYEIVREVGRGATAIVYLARQTDLDREVALKELASFHAADAAFIERFLRESRLAGSLNHPNIVTVHEYFEHDGTPYIAMEYLERGSLRPLMTGLEVPQVVGALEGLLAGLGHAHARGVVHRDLKPENVMVTSGGSIKITDFGIAKALAESDSPLTLSGTTVGTPAYMAPEQALAGEVGPAADVYAVGVMAYEMLARELPFHGSEVAMAIMLQHLNDPVPSLHAARPDLDLELCDWVERALAKEPSRRPGSAADAWDELDEISIRVLGPRWRRQSRMAAAVEEARATAPPEATASTARLGPPRRFPTGPSRAWVVAVVSLLALMLLAGGVATAVALSNADSARTNAPLTSTDASRPATETFPHEQQQPVARTTLAAVDLDTRIEPATVTLRLTGRRLGAAMILVRDDDLTDGHGWFELEKAGLAAQTNGAANNALSVRVRKGKRLLRFDLRSDPGTFDRFEARRLDGHTVSLTLVPSAPPFTATTQTEATSTDTTPTKPTTPTRPEKPQFGTR